MRFFFLLLASITANSADLIHLSNDSSTANLEILIAKYQQTLLLSDNSVYLIPIECQSERYFGGASEGVLNIIKGPIRTETVLNTQDVFEAKHEKDIVKKIELEKTFAIAEGKISRDFLEDKEGRGYGGASEIPLIIHNDIEADVSETLVTVQSKKEVIHPACQLLEDGSGYKITPLNNGRLYIDGVVSPISNNTVLFR
ncbi:MAG: hypothetical protein Q8S36_06780 [Sulfuricurvum sp.]|nr:hypothetical protein [Sulfuricurvum sp.]